MRADRVEIQFRINEVVNRLAKGESISHFADELRGQFGVSYRQIKLTAI